MGPARLESGGNIGRRRVADAPITGFNRCTISHQILHQFRPAPFSFDPSWLARGIPVGAAIACRCTISHQILHRFDVAPPGGEISVEDESNAETPRLGEEKRGEETGLDDGKVTQNLPPSLSSSFFFPATRRLGVQS